MKQTAILLLVLPLLFAACGGGGGADRKTLVAPPTLQFVDQGDPVMPPAAGYVGSSSCETCHADLFDHWKDTFHNLSVRTTERVGATGKAVVGDADGNGTDDFMDGLDLASDADFAAFGGAAPELMYVAGDAYPYKAKIGDLVFDVWRTLGGNGLWAQRYLTRIGDSVFSLPFQYIEKTGNWAPYAAETWFDGTGAARFADAATVADDVDATASFDLNCMGCHATGLDIAYVDDQYKTGYRDLGIGCEACHGPGEEHVNAGGDPALILNPEDLADGTPNGVLAGDLICGRCHITGRSEAIAGAPLGSQGAGYPWQNGVGTYAVGSTDLDSFFTVTTDPDHFWLPNGGSGIAARKAEMHFVDLTLGAHAPDFPWDPTCFSCHNPHAKLQEHQLRTEIVENGATFTGVQPNNNTLCLVCHHGHGDFAAVTGADVAGITDTFAPSGVVSAVVDHMKDKAAMPIAPGSYDPAGTKVGRCVTCHMVKLGKSAAYTTDAAGNNVGDIHSHTFEAVWPNLSELSNPRITNSCSICHPLGPNDEVGDVIAEWAVDTDGDTTFHAGTPAGFQGGVANVGRDGGVACVKCHTTEGFLEIQVNGNDPHALNQPGDAARRSEILGDAIQRAHGITCRACHGKNQAGQFAAGDIPLRFPKDELCGRCHNNQTVRYIDYRDAGEIVRHPQREMLAGNAGAEVPGESYFNGIHTTLVGTNCTECHFKAGRERKHTFEATTGACNVCHSGLTEFNRPSTTGDDFDGDGTVEGIEDEIHGALEKLKDAILAATPSVIVTIEFDGEYFLINGNRANSTLLDPVADAAILRGMFNHYYVEFDASGGIHNTTYAVQLIHRSYEEITGTAMSADTR